MRREPKGLEVRDAPARNRFEVTIGDETAFLRYRLTRGALELVHTEVPEALEGHGVGGQLARAALESAKARGLAVIPICPFVRDYLEKHPEYADLVRVPDSGTNDG